MDKRDGRQLRAADVSGWRGRAFGSAAALALAACAAKSGPAPVRPAPQVGAASARPADGGPGAGAGAQPGSDAQPDAGGEPDAGTATSTNTPTTTTPIPPDPPAATALPATCQGADLDLRALFARKDCHTIGAAAPLPAAVRASLEPSPLSIRAGAPIRGRVILANTAAQPVDLTLEVPCGIDDQVTATIRDLRTGARVDRAGTACGMGMGCGVSVVRLRIAPHGRAHFAFTASSRIERFDQDCESRRSGPVPPGGYRLAVRVAFLQQTLEADVHIRGRR